MNFKELLDGQFYDAYDFINFPIDLVVRFLNRINVTSATPSLTSEKNTSCSSFRNASMEKSGPCFSQKRCFF